MVPSTTALSTRKRASNARQSENERQSEMVAVFFVRGIGNVIFFVILCYVKTPDIMPKRKFTVCKMLIINELHKDGKTCA